MPPTVMIMSHLLFDVFIKCLLEMVVKLILPVITVETVYRYVHVVPTCMVVSFRQGT